MYGASTIQIAPKQLCKERCLTIPTIQAKGGGGIEKLLLKYEDYIMKESYEEPWLIVFCCIFSPS